MMLLKDRTAVITGCNRGIGKSMLEAFARNGANIFACARIPTDAFRDHVKSVADDTGVVITPIFFDLANADQVKSASREIISYKHKIDILVNNAGVASGSLFQMTSLDELRRTFEINYFSQILFSQGLSRYMARFRSGSIINIASAAGILSDEGTLSYGTSKAALIHATKIMAKELGAANIRVNAIAPGITTTDMHDQMDEKAREAMIRASALKRAASPTDVTNAALFLASDLSQFITGQVLRVDGGLN